MIPTYEEFMMPLMQILSDGEARKNKELRYELQKRCGLSDDDMNELIPSGSSRAEGNMNWAVTYLYQAGLIVRPRKGFYSISEEGRALLKTGVSSITRKYLEEKYPSLYEFTHRHHSKKSTSSNEIVVEDETESRIPEDIIKDNLHQLMENLIDQLLEEVRNIHPQRFEQLVVDLMLKMGYGGEDENAGFVTSYTGDEGIDGVIKEDILGLDTIYIQAKRYSEGNKIDRPTLQSFVGALDVKHAKKGVFITTSSFTNTAIDYVKQTSARIILIDGRQLCRYMIQFNLGVVTKEILELKQLDQNYFSSEE